MYENHINYHWQKTFNNNKLTLSKSPEQKKNRNETGSIITAYFYSFENNILLKCKI